MVQSRYGQPTPLTVWLVELVAHVEVCEDETHGRVVARARFVIDADSNQHAPRARSASLLESSVVSTAENAAASGGTNRNERRRGAHINNAAASSASQVILLRPSCSCNSRVDAGHEEQDGNVPSLHATPFLQSSNTKHQSWTSRGRHLQSPASMY